MSQSRFHHSPSSAHVGATEGNNAHIALPHKGNNNNSSSNNFTGDASSFSATSTTQAAETPRITETSTSTTTTSNSPMRIVRPFPPPALENVPLPYILDQLHNLALHYWDKPATADCTIIVPIHPPRGPSFRPRRNNYQNQNQNRNQNHTQYQTQCTTNNNNHNNSDNNNNNNNELITRCASGSRTRDGYSRSRSRSLSLSGVRRSVDDEYDVGGNIAGPSQPTRMTSKLHLDYLLAQSTLFRELFAASPSSLSSTSAYSSIRPYAQRPTFLPGTTPTHPIIYLPLPDPSSWPHLAHALYFGRCQALGRALEEGSVQWEGCVRNVEYLGLVGAVGAGVGGVGASGSGTTMETRCGVKQFLAEWAARRRLSVVGPREGGVSEDGRRRRVGVVGGMPGMAGLGGMEGDWSDVEFSDSDSDSSSGSECDSDCDSDSESGSEMDSDEDVEMGEKERRGRSGFGRALGRGFDADGYGEYKYEAGEEPRSARSDRSFGSDRSDRSTRSVASVGSVGSGGSDRSDTDGSLETLVDEEYTRLLTASRASGDELVRLRKGIVEVDVGMEDSALDIGGEEGEGGMEVDDYEMGRGAGMGAFTSSGLGPGLGVGLGTEERDTQRGRSRVRVRPRVPSPSPPGRGRAMCRAFS